MNDGEGEDAFRTPGLPSPSADEAFGSSMNNDFNDDDSDVPF